MNKTLLRIDDVAFRYGTRKVRVLHDIFLEVEEGSATAILGPNGVGKTTLLHLMLGWHQPERGHLELDGRPLSSYDQRARGRMMGLVPQREYIPFEYSMIEYVLLGRVPYLKPLESPGTEDIRVAVRALETVGLDPNNRRPITRFSGGERQLLMIARTLAQQPRVILLDEPTAHLDLRNKRAIVNILRKQLERGVTLLFTTHEPEMAAALAHRLVLLRNGTILRTGRVEEVMTGDLLSETYGSDIGVARVRGRPVTLW
jgi:iron complex transport system ATP-binding protein